MAGRRRTWSVLSPSLVIVAAVTSFLWLDPLQIGLLSGLHFDPQYAPFAPYADVARISDPENRLLAAKLEYVEEVFGPESLAFDSAGGGPYTGLSDGRVVRRSADRAGWETVATTSPLWNATLCSYPAPPALPRPNLAMEHICGRPLGLRFHPITGDLYVCDAYKGLFVVPKDHQLGCSATDAAEGAGAGGSGEAADSTAGKSCRAGASRPTFGAPRLLASTAEGTPLKFVNDLDIDATDGAGVVYFTDTSSKFGRRNFLVAILEAGTHGRLLKLDLASGAVSVLVRRLAFPNGVALSKDRSFLVFCETSSMRCHKYTIKGPKAGTLEKLIDLPGSPDNVRLNPRGRFWIAVHARRNSLSDFLNDHKWARVLLLRLVPSIKAVYLFLIGYPHGMIIEVDENGKVTDVLEDSEGKVVKAVSEVEEHGGKLWLGSVLMPHVAVLDAK